MTVHFLTMVPTSGDGPYPGSDGNPAGNWSSTGTREPNLQYISQIARASEEGGFQTLLLPVGTFCLDGWVATSFIAGQTSTLRFLVALRPGFVSPTVAARQASTFDYLSGGRLSINIVTGGSPQEQARDGDFLEHDVRYRRTREYIRLTKRYFTEANVNHEGEFYRVEGANIFPRPVQNPHPPFFIAGESEPGKEVIADEAQVYMTWGGPVEDLRQKLEDVRSRVTARGRTIGYSISFQVILGDTEDEAWAKAAEMRSRMSENAINRQKEHFRTMDSVGQRRLQGYVESSANNDFRLGPNLWAGLTQVLGGNSISLVGTPDQVADRLVEYIGLGYNHVLLRGFPHLEVIQQLGRDVLPRVRAKLAAVQQESEAGHVVAAS
jgi:alkanesulfonate monooxygenase